MVKKLFMLLKKLTNSIKQLTSITTQITIKVVLKRGLLYMQNNELLTVERAFQVLQKNGIVNNIEVLRRWLRQDKLKGIAPTSRKEGWRVEQTVLDAFIADQLAIMQNKAANAIQNEVVVLDENVIIDAARAEMWYQITSKNFWQGHYTITQKQVKDAIEHRGYSNNLSNEVWERLKANSPSYKQPRVNYLLDACSFEGKRILFDSAFVGHERALFPIIEHVRMNRNKVE